MFVFLCHVWHIFNYISNLFMTTESGWTHVYDLSSVSVWRLFFSEVAQAGGTETFE